MLKKMKLVAVVFALLIVVAGCNSEPSIVGIWQAEGDSVKLTLNKDGTFYITDESLEDKDILSGTYRLEGDQFLYTPTHEAELANTFTLKDDTLTLSYQGNTSTFKRIQK